MSLAATPPIVALGVRSYVPGNKRTYLVGPFVGDNGQPLTFADDTVDVIVRDGVGGSLYEKHSATNPNTSPQDGIATDRRGFLTYTITGEQIPKVNQQLRLQVQIQRTFNDSTGNPPAPFTVTLGEGDILVRPSLF